MKANFWSKRIGAATLTATLLFTGNALADNAATAEEAPLAVMETAAPGETTSPTQPTEPAPAWEESQQIASQADGRHIFVYDALRSEMLYCNTDPTDRLYPASITKVYAAWVALMHLEPDAPVTAGAELDLVSRDSSRAYINRGSTLQVQMLVEAMLLPSGSDASYVLAAAAGRAIAGDLQLPAGEAVALFLEEMNRQAKTLGLVNSHFTNPDGYHSDDHYMCPADVATVTALALDDPIIARYSALQQDSVRFESGEHITWYSNNQLITPTSAYYSPQATGMKTGYTGQAGHCLLATYQQDSRVLIVGIFGSAQRYPRYQTANQLFALWS